MNSRSLLLAAFSIAALAGCTPVVYDAPPGPPPAPAYYYQPQPAPIYEPVPSPPFYGAVWVRGYYFRWHHGWRWHHGYYRHW